MMKWFYEPLHLILNNTGHHCSEWWPVLFYHRFSDECKADFLIAEKPLAIARGTDPAEQLHPI